MELSHYRLTLPDLTLADRIFHGMINLTCTLRDAPAIACDNQLTAIQAIRQAIQKRDHPNLPSSVHVAPFTPPSPDPKQSHSILHPMRRQTPVQPPASLPRVFILTHKASLSAPGVPSTQEKDDPIAQRTRSRVTHTVIFPSPRVDKATDSVPIACHARSQTTSMENVSLQPRQPNDSTQTSFYKV